MTVLTRRMMPKTTTRPASIGNKSLKKSKASILALIEGSLTFKEAMWLAREHGKAVRCGYMSPGWCIRWIASAQGWFNINPHTGGIYQFTPQQIDHDEKWSVL